MAVSYTHLDVYKRQVQDDPTRPFLLLVVDLLAELPAGSPLTDVETDAALALSLIHI